jgi:copper homeostasis protein
VQPSAADGHNPHVPRELEICCYSVSDAQIAERFGADRIELCAGRPEGGTTASLGVLRSAIESLTIPVFPMVRPRGGDFVYDDLEFSAMCDDVRTIAEMGFRGLVFGILDSSGGVDVGRSAALLDIARQANPAIEVTFHRAFDEVSDPIAAYQQLANLGFSRLLTSGLEPTAIAGSSLISELINDHGNVPIVMPGGSVRPDNVNTLLALGATNVHSSATPSSESGVDASMVRELASAVHPG